MVRQFVLDQDISDVLAFGGMRLNELKVGARFGDSIKRVHNAKLELQIRNLGFGHAFSQPSIDGVDRTRDFISVQRGDLVEIELRKLQRE